MVAPANPSQPGVATWRRDLLLLALIFGAVYFFRLGSYPLSNPDEGRYAEIPREMLASGDWVTPRLNDVTYFEKPPLVYWITAAFQAAFGLNEWSVRAVPALFGVLGVLLTYAAGRALRDRLTGWLAALILGTCLLWVVLAHVPLLDMPMAVFMSGTLFCFILGVQEPRGARRRWLFMGLYACAALATLTKGLMGFLVTGAVMVLWLTLCGQWRRLLPLYLPSGVLLFLIIALPWHVLAALRNETWAHRYLVYEHFLRFLTPVASREGPWHYFIWVILGGMIPWIGFLGQSLGSLCKAGWRGRKEQTTLWFLVIWAGFIVFFFSISKSKLPPYVLPVFPALALLAAVALAGTINAGARGSVRLSVGIHAFFCGLLAVAVGVVIARPALVKMPPAQAEALRPSAIALALVLVASAALTPWLAKRRGPRAAVIAITVTMLAFFSVLKFAAPVLNKPGTKDLALWVKAHARPDDRIYHCYDFYQDFTYYAERFVGIVGENLAELQVAEDPHARASGRFIDEAELRRQWAGPGRIFLVVRVRKFAEFERLHAAALARWDAEAEQARLANRAFATPQPQPPALVDPGFRYHLIAQTPSYYLVSNQP